MWYGTDSVRNRRGATLTLVAVSLFALLGCMALAIDLSMLFKARGDAQRAADAAALAGASAFQDEEDPVEVVPLADRRADSLAAANTLMGTPIDSTSEVTVQVVTDSQKVRVWVRRANVPTWFARTLGFAGLPIGAHAAAEAIDAGEGKCVKPFAVPDAWDDMDDDLNSNEWWDADPNQGGQDGEEWEWEPETAGDHYRRFEGEGSGVETGLGSDFRNALELPGQSGDPVRYYRDQGRPITIKMSNPQAAPAPGNFYPWVLPGSDPGAKDYRENIQTCNPVAINLETDYGLDDDYLNKPGNMIGPTKQGVDSLIAQDPDAHWVESAPNAEGYTEGEIVGSKYPNPMDSPRVMLVPLMDPTYITNGRAEIKFNNLALLFLEEFDNAHGAVTARFIKFARGTSPEGPETGSLIKVLRLVE